MQPIGLSFVAFARRALFYARLLTLQVLALPPSWAGNRLGIQIFRRTSEVNYQRSVSGAFC